MVKGPDPRQNAAPREEVPRLLREGAAEFDAGRFWHAHEAWEAAWHSLRAAGEPDTAAYLRGMILVSAALENANRGKESGFKRQFAEGLHQLHANADGAGALGLAGAAAWERALFAFYADACRHHDWERWNGSGWSVPRVPFA